IRKIDFMSRCDNATRTDKEFGIHRVDYFGVGNRVDFVKSDYLRVSSESHLFTAANNVEMPDAHVVAQRNVRDPNHYVKVADGCVFADFAAAGVDDAQAHAHTFSNLVTKEEAI